MKVVIDRFEGPYAVCRKENKSMIDIKRINIPVGTKEGDILHIEGNQVKLDSSGVCTSES